MLSRENRVVLAGFLGAGAALVALLVVETQAGDPIGWSSLILFVLVGIVGLAVPQSYLALTDSSVSPSSRIRVTLVILVLLALMLSPDAGRWEGVAIWAITILAGLLAIAFEFRSGYLAGAESSGSSS